MSKSSKSKGFKPIPKKRSISQAEAPDKVPYSEVMKMDLKVSMVDANAQDLRISSENFIKLEKLSKKS